MGIPLFLETPQKPWSLPTILLVAKVGAKTRDADGNRSVPTQSRVFC